jgi:hypothetical protein
VIARVALLGVIGCAPKINDLNPRHAIICPGDSVQVSWDVSGTATLNVTPATPGAPSGSVDSTSGFKLTPTGPHTAVVIRASRMFRQDAIGETDIDVNTGELVNASITDPSVTCTNNVLTSTAHLDPKSFAADVMVAKVGVDGNDQRKYTITHNGKSASVGPGIWSQALAGLPMRGDWTISTTLLAGEACDPAQNLPNNLPVRAYSKCGGSP